MGALFTPAYEPTPTTASPNETFVFASNPTPSPALSQATTGSSNGAIHLTTIFAIVVGLVGFVLLVLAGSFISRLPYFRQPQGVLPTSPRPRPRPWPHTYTRRDLPYHNHNINRPRPHPRPPIQHVEPMIFGTSMLTPTVYRTQPCDYNTYDLPPYGGPSPPPYSEALQHTPQHLHAPPRAVVEA